MSKFTKGKWKVKYSHMIQGIFDEDDDPVELNEANARLIAAAPEMYRLLKILSSINEPVNEERFDDLLLAVDEVRKVLSRIDGEEDN